MVQPKNSICYGVASEMDHLIPKVHLHSVFPFLSTSMIWREKFSCAVSYLYFGSSLVDFLELKTVLYLSLFDILAW